MGAQQITFASLQRESVVAVETHIAHESADSRLAIALTRVLAAVRISASDPVTLAADATARRLQVPEAIDALVACAARYILAAKALTRVLIARSTHRTIWIAAAFCEAKIKKQKRTNENEIKTTPNEDVIRNDLDALCLVHTSCL